MSANDSFDRRDFLKTVSATGVALTTATTAFAGKTGSKMSGGRVIGANDRINVGVIGCGGRGRYDADAFNAFATKHNNACQIVAACDVYEKRKKMVADKFKVKGTLDYREVLNQSDVDAVIIATPDHWHGKIAMDA